MHRKSGEANGEERKVQAGRRVSPQRNHAKDGRRSRARLPAKNELNSMERLDYEASRSGRLDECAALRLTVPRSELQSRLS